MLSSIRGAAASAMGAASARLATPRSLGPAPTASIPQLPREVGVVVNISQAGLEAARRRSASPQLGQVNPVGRSGDVPMVQPRLLNLDTSTSLEANGPLSGNELMEEGTRTNAKPSLLSSLARGAAPLGRWTDRSVSQVFSRPPGASILQAGARQRSSNTLSARLQNGAVPLGQWNSGQYANMQASRPGKEIADHGSRARSSTTLTARIAKGEEPLEVSPGRHIVRPDGDGNDA